MRALLLASVTDLKGLIPFVLLGIVLCSPAAAQVRLTPDEDTAELLRRIDSDRDGYVTREEWNRFFADHDDNRDGILSLEEMRIREGESRQAELEQALEDAFSRLDGNKDNQVSTGEWPGTQKYFKRVDANLDGTVTREEFRSPNARYWNELFENIDANRDLVISRQEWLDTEESFKRLDRDRDGVVTSREFYTLW
jgi:Ca2+-binding EF-hand superfamily protein